MNTNKILYAAIAIILVLQVVSLFTGKNAVLGSATHFSGPVDSEEGFSVDDTTVIDGSGNFDGAVTAGSASTFASTVTVTGETNLGTLVEGGSVTTINSTSTNARETLTAAQICDSSIIKINLAIVGNEDAAGTWFLPTSTDIISDCLPDPGDFKRIKFWNYSTSTYAITFSQRSIASTSLDFQWATSTVPAALPLAAGEFRLMTFQNLNDATTSVDFISLIQQ